MVRALCLNLYELDELLATRDETGATELSANLQARLCFGKQTPQINGALSRGRNGKKSRSASVNSQPHFALPGTSMPPSRYGIWIFPLALLTRIEDTDVSSL
jgi:hypothetical protein